MEPNRAFKAFEPRSGFPAGPILITAVALCFGAYFFHQNRSATSPNLDAKGIEQLVISPKKGTEPEIPVDLKYQDPIPQAIRIEADEPAAETQLAVPDHPWVVLLTESTEMAAVERMARVFTQRKIELLLRNPGNVYMACIRFDDEASAQKELLDFYQRPEDLAKLGIQPKVINLNAYDGSETRP